MSTLAFAVVGYLAGSIPTGHWLVARCAVKTSAGSGAETSAPPTSGGRTERATGVPVIVLDTLKGFVPALLATIYVGRSRG